ncbi:TspO protein, partial [Candidatus Pacearchaeota archaeon CG10_big_fil_rev_8_21_14_0_10_35_13]
MVKKKGGKKFNFWLLVICLVVVYAVAFLGSLFTAPNTSTDWYNSIRPSITPPNWVFPVVWNILFLLIGISLYLSLHHSGNSTLRKFVVFSFGINLFLNLVWSILYFGLHSPLAAFFDLILLWVSILLMIRVSWK